MNPKQIKHAQAMAAAGQQLAAHMMMTDDAGLLSGLKEAHKNLMLERRQYVMDCISECGKVAVVESGRDCDGVQYSGNVHIIDATNEAYEALYQHTAEWADGPFYFELMRFSASHTVKAESRDLVMEAHEEGHPHVLYSAFP